MRSPCLPSMLRISTGSVASRTEPVREPGVELGDLTGSHRDVVVGEDQAQLPGQHVEPLVAVVGAQLGFAALGRDDHLPRVLTGRLLGQRHDDAAVADPRLEPDPGIADLGRADELVERHPVRLGDRQEQLQAGLALARFQA